MKVGLLLLAAGSGKRLGGEVPKQYQEVAGKPMIYHTLVSLAAEPRIEVVQPVIAKNDRWFAAIAASQLWPFTLLAPVVGGDERAQSMAHGLAALPEEIDVVAVHDAARVLPSPELLKNVLDMADFRGAAVPGLPVHDTIKRIDRSGRVLETLERNTLIAVQTPQVAKRFWLEQALKREGDNLTAHTDDASVLEAAGYPVYISEGDVKNRKITTPYDMLWLEETLSLRQAGHVVDIGSAS